MNKADDIKKIITKHKPYLQKKYGIKSIGLFGSYIRGKQKKDSDIDILVEFNKTVGLFEFMDVEFYLEDILGKDVDLVMKSALKPHIGENILREVNYL